MTRAHSGEQATDGDIASRVAAVVDAVIRARASGAGVRELAAATDTSRSSAHRTLTALAEAGVVQQIQGGRYAPGLALAVWSWHTSYRSPLLEVGGRVLGDLVNKIGETAHLIGRSPVGHVAVVLDLVESGRPVRYRLPLGSPIPLHAGSAGKAVAAYLADDVLADLPFDAITARTTTDRDALHSEFAAIRERGYATTTGERFEEAAGVSAPYFVDGLVGGSLNVTVPRYRLGTRGVEQYATLVLDAAKTLTAELAVRDAFPDTVHRAGPATSGPGFPRSGNRTIDRTVSVLDGVARGVSGVQAGDRAAPEPVVRALTTAGVLRLRRDGRYEPGLTLLLWSRLLQREATPDSIGSEILRPVIDELGETAAVVVLDPLDGTARYGEPVESAQPIQYLVPPRTAVPLHAGAAGRAILAFADDVVRAGVELTSLTDDTITDPHEIEDSLAEIRRVGYAVSRQERVADAAAVAAPFFADGKVLGSLTTMIPLYRLERLDLAHHGQVLRAAADRLSGLLSLTGS